jgi:hypothetical protein
MHNPLTTACAIVACKHDAPGGVRLLHLEPDSHAVHDLAELCTTCGAHRFRRTVFEGHSVPPTARSASRLSFDTGVDELGYSGGKDK